MDSMWQMLFDWKGVFAVQTQTSKNTKTCFSEFSNVILANGGLTVCYEMVRAVYGLIS